MVAAPNREGADLLDRTEADAVGLAKGAVDGAGLGDAHLGAVDQGGNVGGIRVSIANEALGARGPVNGGAEHPAARSKVTEFADHLGLDARTTIPPG